MPTNRSTFTKRQKEHTRQQRQRYKAERRNQRKLEKAVVSVRVDEVAESGEHAAAQPALFELGAADAVSTLGSTLSDGIGEQLGLQAYRG